LHGPPGQEIIHSVTENEVLPTMDESHFLRTDQEIQETEKCQYDAEQDKKYISGNTLPPKK
jgi:hypothetical protein